MSFLLIHEIPKHTLIHLHICNSLPLIHSHKPGVIPLPTTQVDYEFRLVIAKRRQYGSKTVHGERRIREKVGCDDYLL